MQYGHQCYQFRFELGERFLQTSMKTRFAPTYVSKKEYPISDEELSRLDIYQIRYQQIKNKHVKNTKSLCLYKRYMWMLDQFIEKNQIDIICFFNGHHWLDQIAMYIAKKRQIEIRVFEEGHFRPYTITYDRQGVNAYASIPRERAFYQHVKVDRERYPEYVFKPESCLVQQGKKDSLSKLALIKTVNHIGSLLGIHPKLYEHSSFLESVRYFWNKRRFAKRGEDDIDWPKEYILLPFQVEHDTQILFHSPHISTMEELLERTLMAVREVIERENRHIHVMVKEHPEEHARNAYLDLKQKYKQDEQVIFVTKHEVEPLIEKALAIITINSTVGIEALSQYKHVITLGEALYNIEGIAHHCPHPSHLAETLATVLKQEINQELIDQFLYYLRFIYQIEGSIHLRNRETTHHIVSRMVSEQRRIQNESYRHYPSPIRVH